MLFIFSKFPLANFEEIYLLIATTCLLCSTPNKLINFKNINIFLKTVF